jgi:DNA-binding response OmpR family regulator
MIFVVENEAPLVRLMVCALREAGFEAVSAPMPDENARFSEQAPECVIINCALDARRCAEVVAAVRRSVPAALILDLNGHDGTVCAADDHLAGPPTVADAVKWLKANGLPCASAMADA